MLEKYYQRVFFIIFISFDLLIIESTIKYWLVSKIPPEGFYLFLDLIQLAYFKNPNIAFSLPVPIYITIVLIIMALIILSLLWWWHLVLKESIQLLGISLIIVGAVSNLIDRFVFGYVIDYFNIFIWPVFNLADVMVVIGVILYLAVNFIKEKKKNK